MSNAIDYCMLMFLKTLRDKCIKINELDPTHILSGPGLAWQACLKKKQSRTRIINRY